MSKMAVRHPKRGKAHREIHFFEMGGSWLACGGNARDMRQRVPVEKIAPEDRCKRCWPTSEPKGAGE